MAASSKLSAGLLSNRCFELTCRGVSSQDFHAGQMSGLLLDIISLVCCKSCQWKTLGGQWLETEAGTMPSLKTASGGLAPSRLGGRAGDALFSPVQSFQGAPHLPLAGQEPSEPDGGLLSLEGGGQDGLNCVLESSSRQCRASCVTTLGKALSPGLLKYQRVDTWGRMERRTPRGKVGVAGLWPCATLSPTVSAPCSVSPRRGANPCPPCRVSAGTCLSPPVPCAHVQGPACVSHSCSPFPSRPHLQASPDAPNSPPGAGGVGF